MDHRKRLAHARHHLKILERAVRVFIKREPYMAVGEYDRKRRCYVARVRRVLDVPDRWSLVVGDVTHNLRAALDNLTYALAIKHSGVPSKTDVRRIQFPICTHPVAFHGSKTSEGERQRRLWLLSPEAQAAIELLQPYHIAAKPGHTHNLAALNELSNIDKHRHILLVVGAAQSSKVSISGRGISGEQTAIGYSGELHDRTELTTWAFESPRSSARQAHPNVDVHAHLAFEIRFGQGTPLVGGPVIGVLRALHEHVRDKVFPPLEALL